MKITKKEFIEAVKTNPEARSAALAIAYVVLQISSALPALQEACNDFEQQFFGGGCGSREESP